MITKCKFRFAVLTMSMGLLGFSGVAHAATLPVSYYTVGTFTTSTADGSYFTISPDGGTSVTISSKAPNAATVTLSFAGVGTLPSPFPVTLSNGVPTDPFLLSGADLGTFSLSETGSKLGLFGENIGFELDIYQEVPTTGGGLTGDFVGKAQLSLTLTQSGAEIDFDAPYTFPSLSDPSVTYKLNPVSYTLAYPNLGGEDPTVQVTADLSAPGLGAGPHLPSAPLPAVAGMSMTMFGLLVCSLAGRKLARRASMV